MKNKRLKNFSMFLYMLRHFPTFVLGELLEALLSDLVTYISTVVFLKYIISAMVTKKAVNEMLIWLAVFALFQIGADLYRSFYGNIARPKLYEKIRRWFYYDLKNGIGNYELYVYDNPDFYDDMTYVSTHLVDDATASVSYISEIVSALVSIALILRLFSQIEIVVLFIVCLSILLSIVLDIPIIRLNNKKKYDINRITRKKSYFLNCFFLRSSFMERKMTGIGDVLNSRYLESVDEQKECERKYSRKIFGLSALKEVLSSNLLLYFVLFAYLLYETLIAHCLSGSDFIGSYSAANVIASSIMTMVSIWGKMKSSAYTIEKYHTIRVHGQNVEQMADKESPFEKITSIELKNVSFLYPGTEKLVLNKINMKLALGDKIAIVGKNGSGKTTLVHLLMGLYTPTEGEILINGKVITKSEYSSMRHQFAAFFQGMRPIEASIAENVALDTEIDLDRVKLALEKTGSKKLLERSPNDTIGVRFCPNGLILSGGEFQKLMLSHCFYSEKTSIVMDEPSSALDPLAERNFNDQVGAFSEGKLVVYVTHRLSTVHMAHLIYVINDGQICGFGTHETLVEENEVYREMWNIQAEKYRLMTADNRQ